MVVHQIPYSGLKMYRKNKGISPPVERGERNLTRETYHQVNGEVSVIDRMGEGLSLIYRHYAHNQNSVVEVTVSRRTLTRAFWSREYHCLIERSGMRLSEFEIRSLLSWKGDFVHAVHDQYPADDPVLQEIFSALEARMRQIKDIRESAKKSTKMKTVKTSPRKTRKKRGK